MIGIFRSRISSRVVLGVQGLVSRSFAPLSSSAEAAAAGSNVRATGPNPVRRHPHLKSKRPLVQKYRKINGDLEAKAASQKLPFRLVGATILHRYPTILPSPEPWELEFFQLQDKIAAKKREKLMEEIGGSDAQMIPQENASFEDILASMPFKPASRTTEADAKNDRKSLERKLDQSLFLIVKRARDSNAWQFPQGKIQDTETLRQAGERVVDRATGGAKRYFISNAPAGHYAYEYPADLQQQRGQFGAKVFFTRAQYLGGPIKLETRLYKDFAWISRDEIGEYFDAATVEYLKHLLPY